MGTPYAIDPQTKIPHGPQPTQSRDGTPHLAYFHERTQLSYVWNGASAMIEVCLGGYGEPILEMIESPWVAALTHNSTFEEVLAAFWLRCSQHAEQQPSYEER